MFTDNEIIMSSIAMHITTIVIALGRLPKLPYKTRSEKGAQQIY